MPSTRYGEIAPKVRDVCKRYDLPYNTGPFSKQWLSVQRTILRLAFPGGKPRPKPGPYQGTTPTRRLRRGPTAPRATGSSNGDGSERPAPTENVAGGARARRRLGRNGLAQPAVDGASAAPSLGDSGDDQRLADAGVAGGETPGRESRRPSPATLPRVGSSPSPATTSSWAGWMKPIAIRTRSAASRTRCRHRLECARRAAGDPRPTTPDLAVLALDRRSPGGRSALAALVQRVGRERALRLQRPRRVRIATVRRDLGVDVEQVRGSAPSRQALDMQSIPVSPPPTTTTRLPAALIAVSWAPGQCRRALRAATQRLRR